jgi:hypothetical protein
MPLPKSTIVAAVIMTMPPAVLHSAGAGKNPIANGGFEEWKEMRAEAWSAHPDKGLQWGAQILREKKDASQGSMCLLIKGKLKQQGVSTTVKGLKPKTEYLLKFNYRMVRGNLTVRVRAGKPPALVERRFKPPVNWEWSNADVLFRTGEHRDLAIHFLVDSIGDDADARLDAVSLVEVLPAPASEGTLGD